MEIVLWSFVAAVAFVGLTFLGVTWNFKRKRGKR